MALASGSLHSSESRPTRSQAPPPSIAVPPPLQGPPSVAETLTGLHNSPAHHALLLDWRTEDKTLRFRMHRKEQNLSAAESEIYHLLGIFSLFQGVFFGALAQTSLFHCEDWTIPFAMSLVVSVATVIAVEEKIRAFADINVELSRAKQEIDVLYTSIEALMAEGCRYDLNRLNFEPRVPIEYDDLTVVQSLLGEYILRRANAVRAVVICLSVIIMISCKMILCRGCKCRS